jgi:mannosyl-3-phosphoglycerate phosphatase
MGIVIFSDLDGSLLHKKTYSFAEAGLSLEMIRRREIPLVFISSKTRTEIELFRQRIGNGHPFIAENGGGIFIPEGYFGFPVGGTPADRYTVLLLGAPYGKIREGFTEIREALGVAARGFGDMEAAEISALTGLPVEEVPLAKMREFDEPFVFPRGPDHHFLSAIEKKGLRWTRGGLFHIMGKSDKGRALRILKKFYERRDGGIVSLGLGDAFNDLPMLREVDHPVLIRKEDGSLDPDVDLPSVMRTKKPGPAGWNDAVLALFAVLADLRGPVVKTWPGA